MNLSSEHVFYKEMFFDQKYASRRSGAVMRMQRRSRRTAGAILFLLALIAIAGIRVGYGMKLTDPPKSGGAVRKNAIGMELVKIPGGKSYKMGSPANEGERDADEGPQRDVTIKQDFWMGVYEVTQAEWQKVMGTSPSGFRDCARCPVENVSWDDAKEFIAKLNAMNDGFVYRLPSEAEWEYAARAGSSAPFAHGSSLSPEEANFDSRYPYGGAAKGQYIVKTEPVGSYKPNAFGLYDMHGNVWEWVEDIYVKAGYQGIPADGSANGSNGDPYKRVRRGGGWDSWGKALRSANRGWKNPRDRNQNGGFRVAASEK